MCISDMVPVGTRGPAGDYMVRSIYCSRGSGLLMLPKRTGWEGQVQSLKIRLHQFRKFR